MNVIHHKGLVKKATTLKGKVVERQEQIFISEWGKFVPCAPYEEHFVYESADVGQSAYMCTCGSPAVIAESKLLVCLFHATYGVHTTSVVNLKDFNRAAGETIEVKGKRWV